MADTHENRIAALEAKVQELDALVNLALRLLAVEKPGHESETLIHLGTLLPRHFALPQSAEVLPMSPE